MHEGVEGVKVRWEGEDGDKLLLEEGGGEGGEDGLSLEVLPCAQNQLHHIPQVSVKSKITIMVTSCDYIT